MTDRVAATQDGRLVEGGPPLERTEAARGA